MNKSSNKWCF